MSRLPDWLVTLWHVSPVWCVLSIMGLLFVVGWLRGSEPCDAP